MSKENTIRFKSLSQFYKALNWEEPKHPLIGVLDAETIDREAEKLKQFEGVSMASDLYCIILKDGTCGLQYGRNQYDFEEGVLQFIGPNRIVSSFTHTPSSYGFFLIFHPDLIRNFDLSKRMHQYSFFNYGTNEALHLSKREERILMGVVDNIKLELEGNIDKHSQEVIVTNLQLLLNYSQRFYERQFITRSNSSSDVISKVETLIREYYTQNLQLEHGTPKPEYFAERVNYSTNYLSDLFKKETGKSIKDHVDAYVIDLAKNELMNTSQTVSEIAYNLGFNYPHYFSRLFKKKTGNAPLEYRTQHLN